MKLLPTAPRRRAALTLALFAAIAAGLFVRLAGDKLYPRSEGRCYAVVGEMVRTGDWLIPRLDGQPRLQKPPLFYWAGATVADLTGARTKLAIRCVSAGAALLLALAVFAVGRSLGGFAAGFCGALALAASALFFVRGRIGDAEMLLSLLVFLSLAAFERLWFADDRRMQPVLAALVGLAFLTKATAALLSILAPILVWLALQRRLRLALRPRTLGWSAFAAAIGLSWYAAILLSVPDAAELLRQFVLAPLGLRPAHLDETLHRDATHVRFVLYYLPRFPIQILPAGLLLIPLAWEAWRERLWRADPRLRFWAVAFLAQLVGWSLVPGKQLHYLLPLVPVFAVVAGRWLGARLEPA